MPVGPAQRPQPGAVEIGGPEPLVGLWNPPYAHLPELCDRMCAYWLRVAALLPRLVIEDLRAGAAGDDLVRVTAVVANHGYLPTWGLDSSRDKPWNAPVYADLEAEGCEIDAPSEAHREVGHLRGWGRGLGQGADSPMFMRSAGNDCRRTLSWLVRGSGSVTLRVGNARVGWVTETLAVGGRSRRGFWCRYAALALIPSFSRREKGPPGWRRAGPRVPGIHCAASRLRMPGEYLR